LGEYTVTVFRASEAVELAVRLHECESVKLIQLFCGKLDFL